MRFCLLLLAGTLGCLAAGPEQAVVRGKLTAHLGKPALETAGHRFISLDGDQDTREVLNDSRLAGFELEARGHFAAPGSFVVDPIHMRALRAFQDGKPKLITYWCDVCSLRFSKPGTCWCCQEETALDFRDPDEPLA
jgi:hypothetical protein